MTELRDLKAKAYELIMERNRLYQAYRKQAEMVTDIFEEIEIEKMKRKTLHE